MILPIELLDIVLDILKLKSDIPSLSALALAHPTLTPRAQQRIFYHVIISGEEDDVDNDNSILLALGNPKHTHLLQYIRSLTLVNVLLRRVPGPNTTYTPNPLIPQFVDTIGPQLTSLSLDGFAPGWEHADAASLRTSITALLSSPALTNLEVDNVFGFSLPLLCRSTSLTNLQFATSYPSYDRGGNDLASDDPPIYLKALSVKLSGEFPPVRFIEWLLSGAPTSRLSVARLQRFTMNCLYTDEVAKAFLSLLDTCRHTLQHLSLGPDDFRYDSSNSFPDLSALRTFQWKTEATYTESGAIVHPVPFNFLVHALTKLPSPSPLEEIDVQVKYTWWYNGARNYRQMDMSIWDPLSFCLIDEVQGGKLACLKCISIGVGTSPTDPDIVTAQDIFPMIGQKFPQFSVGSLASLIFYDLS